MSRDDDYELNVYAVTVPMVTHVTMRVLGPPDADTDDLVQEALAAWKRGEDPASESAPQIDYDLDVDVVVLEDNNEGPEINEDPPEDWERDGPEAA